MYGLNGALGSNNRSNAAAALVASPSMGPAPSATANRIRQAAPASARQAARWRGVAQKRLAVIRRLQASNKRGWAKAKAGWAKAQKNAANWKLNWERVKKLRAQVRRLGRKPVA